MIIVTVDFEAIKELSTLFNGSENSNHEWYFIIVSFIEEEANIMVDIIIVSHERGERTKKSFLQIILIIWISRSRYNSHQRVEVNCACHFSPSRKIGV